MITSFLYQSSLSVELRIGDGFRSRNRSQYPNLCPQFLRSILRSNQQDRGTGVPHSSLSDLAVGYGLVALIREPIPEVHADPVLGFFSTEIGVDLLKQWRSHAQTDGQVAIGYARTRGDGIERDR